MLPLQNYYRVPVIRARMVEPVEIVVTRTPADVPEVILVKIVQVTGQLCFITGSMPIKLLILCIKFFFKVFVGPTSILWHHWYPLFWTSDDSAHEFQRQGEFIITCTLLLLVCNVPQSHLWLLGLGIKP